MPAWETSISTSPSPGTGSGMSSTSRITSGPPHSSIRTARIPRRRLLADLELPLERLRLRLALALDRLEAHLRAQLVRARRLELLRAEGRLERRLLVLFLLLVDREDDVDDLHVLLRRELVLRLGRDAQGDLHARVHALARREQRHLLVASAHRHRLGRRRGAAVVAIARAGGGRDERNRAHLPFVAVLVPHRETL